MDEKLNKVVERIKKLLALSRSPNEHEAARATERAQALLIEHNLSEASIDGRQDDEVVIDHEFLTDSYPWRRPLGVWLAQLYMCQYFYSTFKVEKTAMDRHSFVGTLSNVAVAKLMFAYLETTVDRLACDGAKAVPLDQRSSYRTSFRNACAGRLGIRIAARLAATRHPGGSDGVSQGVLSDLSSRNLPALVGLYEEAKIKVDATMDQIKNSLVTKKQRAFDKHAQGVRDGDKAGETIGLDQQIKSDTRQRLSS